MAHELIYAPVTVADRALIQKFTLASPWCGCDISFSNLCCWGFLYHPEYAVVDEMLFIRFRHADRLAYLFPFCKEGDYDRALNIMRTEVASADGDAPLRLLGVNEEQLAIIDRHFSGKYTATTDRARADYIYRREALATLSGKALQAKRNHVNKFIKTNADWTYEPITHSNIQDCLEMERQWCIANGCDTNEGLGQERMAVIFGLHHYEELGLHGGLLRIGGKIVAFTFGMPINANTFGVHVEKADSNIDGCYAMINREFARHIPEEYLFLNREEDLDIEGLRKAKLSYQPEILLNKHCVIIDCA